MMNQSKSIKLALHSQQFLQGFNQWGLRIRQNNMLPNLIKHQWPDVDKIYLYFKDSFESKNHLLNNGIEKVGIKELNNAKAFIYYLQTLADFY